MKNVEGLAKWCIGLCYALIIAELIFGWHNFRLLNFYIAIENGLAQPELNSMADRIDQLGAFVSICYFSIYVLCLLSISIWIYRTSFNSALLVPSDQRIRPGWAVGWFFIPIFSFWKPYYAMRETWNSSVRTDGDLSAKAPVFFACWWVTWLASNILAQASFRLWRLDELSTLKASCVIDLVNTPVTIVSVILFQKIIRTVSAYQKQGVVPRQVEVFE